MLRRLALAIVMALVARPLAACSQVQFDPNAILQNETFTSPSGRYVVDRREIETITGDADQILVSDDGVSIIAARHLVHCGYPATADDALLTIYAGGQRVGAFKVGDVLTSYDIRMIDSVEFALRRESDTRESVVLTFPAPEKKVVERRIDVATAQLIDPVTAIYPAPHVLIIEQSQTLSERALSQPLPPFPDLMIKANIRGDVRVDVLVSEEGRVVSARASQLPFGGTEAALKAVREWTFRPLVVDGKPVKFAGEVLFSFRDAGE